MFWPKSFFLSALISGVLLPSAWGLSIDFSLPHGLLPSPSALSLSSDTTDTAIYFTLDGSLPSDGSNGSAVLGTRYVEPILIDRSMVVRARAFDGAGMSSSVQTRTYFLGESIRGQPKAPQDFPPKWGRVNADYAVDSRVVHDPRYESHFLDDLRALPWISLVADPRDLFGTNGIYANPLERGTNWERSVSMEWIEADPASSGFQVDAGFQILGESSRVPEVPKHSFRIQFKSKYGPSFLNYPVFTNTTVTRFDTLDLLGGSVDDVPQNFIGSGLALPLHLRDAFLKQSQIDLGRPGVHTSYAHLFLNGLYWGVYRLSERPDASYGRDYFGGKKSDYDTLKHFDFAQLEVANGDRVAWDVMYAIAASGLADPTHYTAIQDYLDLDEFADYMIVNMHLGNGDWPQKNWYATRKRAVHEKFHFFCWDGDAVLGLFGITLNKTDFATPNTPAFLYSQLRANPEFRMRFADRIQKLILGKGPLSIEANQSRLDTIAASMGRAMVGESARWGDAYFARPGKSLFTYDDHWLPELERVRSVVIPGRHPISIAQFRAAQLYPAFDPPGFSPSLGLLGSDNVLTLTTPSPVGQIYYTLDGSDPRLTGGSLLPTSRLYTQPILITRPTLVTACVRERSESDSWSTQVSAQYYPSPAPQVTRIERTVAGVRLEFLGHVGWRYEIMSRDRINSGTWRSVATFPEQTSTATLSFSDNSPPSPTGVRYYKLEGF